MTKVLNRITIVSFSLVVISCAPKKEEGSTSSSSSCSSASASVASIQSLDATVSAVTGFTPSDSRKLRIERGAVRHVHGLGFGALDPDESDVEVPAGTDLVIVVDNACIHKNISTGRAVISQAVFSQSRRRGVQSQRFHVPYDMSFKSLEQMVDADPCVSLVSTNKVHYALGSPSDPTYSSQLHYSRINYETAYDIFYHATTGISQDVILAVIDTGVLLTHEDISANLWTNLGETASNALDDDSNGKIDDIYGWNFADNTNDPSPVAWSGGGEEHGTHVAGLAAARMNNAKGGVGVIGKNVKIMALNVFGGNDGALTTDIDNAIRYAADEGAHVINMSIGGGFPSASTEAAIKYAIDHGSFVVAAAGNSNEKLVDDNRLSPAAYSQCFDGMVTVVSVDSATGLRSTFSNYNADFVEIAAPGAQNSATCATTGGLYSSKTASNSDYGRMCGTSMASPVVAGAVALAISYKKTKLQTNLTPAATEALLVGAAATSADLAPYVKNGKLLDLNQLALDIDSQ